MPRLAEVQMRRRDRIETAQTYLMSSQVRLKQVALRCRQAMERYALNDLLEPAIRGLSATLGDLEKMQALLERMWQEGEDQKWSE